MRYLITSLVIAAAAGVIASPRPHAETAEAMYRANAAHTGTYPASAGRYFAGIQWRYQTMGAVRSSPVVFGGTVYAGSSDGWLYALDAGSGASRWKFNAKSAVTSSPAASEKSVFFESQEGVVYALDRIAGTLRWSYRTGSDIPLAWGHESGDYWSASPALASGRVYVGSGDGYLYAFDASSGRRIWRAKTGGRIRSAPAVSAGVAFIGSYDGCLYAFDAHAGLLRWRFATEGATLRSASYGYDRRSIQSSPSLAGDSVFFGSKDGSIYGIDARSGKLRWRKTANVFWYMSAPAVDQNMVFTGNSDGRFIEALDTATGKVAWQFDTGINVFASPSVSDGVVYTGAWDGKFYALDEKSGKELWNFTTAGRRIFSSAAISQGRVYFGADDGALYALNVSPALSLRKAVFYDPSLVRFSTLAKGVDLRDFLIKRGYELLDSGALRAFLSDRIHDHVPSVVVFAMDTVPAADTEGAEGGVFRRYLNASGKIVWTGDPPALWALKPLEQRQLSDLDRNRPRRLLGVSYERGNFDPMTAFATADGRRWGLWGSWLSAWSADPQSVTDVLAKDEQGLAAAWVRSYGGPAGTGFVDIPLVTSPQGFPMNLVTIQTAAEYFPRE